MSTEEAVVRSGTGELRTDLEPLQKRFPPFAEAESATWMSGTLGDSGVPGPSMYWIDAIVLLPQDEFDRLRQSAGDVVSTSSPTLVDGLDGALPQGQLVSGADLDALFSTSPYQSEVYLDDATRQVVLRSIFE